QFQQDRCERLYGTIQDISERKRIDKMKDEFISTVSHELRTPLTSISGALALMANGVMGDIPEKFKTMLQIAQKNSQRLSVLINDLLDMEKVSAGELQFKIETLSLAPILQAALESNMATGIERMISMAIDNPYPALAIAIDAQRLLQVLSNLLSNAIKYSPNHGHIQITVQMIDDKVRIAVKDQGPGIPAEFQSRMFHKFAQADSSDTRQRGGTGLGLAISKELIEAMQGKLHFSSIYGEGACFYVDLPIASKSH
uniref:sensor histidine kinase n=1 Tax=Undibacterium sp. TaxID=1914977 RepID=UPI00375295F2